MTKLVKPSKKQAALTQARILLDTIERLDIPAPNVIGLGTQSAEPRSTAHYMARRPEDARQVINAIPGKWTENDSTFNTYSLVVTREVEGGFIEVSIDRGLLRRTPPVYPGLKDLLGGVELEQAVSTKAGS